MTSYQNRKRWQMFLRPLTSMIQVTGRLAFDLRSLRFDFGCVLEGFSEKKEILLRSAPIDRDHLGNFFLFIILSLIHI